MNEQIIIQYSSLIQLYNQFFISKLLNKYLDFSEKNKIYIMTSNKINKLVGATASIKIRYI